MSTVDFEVRDEDYSPDYVQLEVSWGEPSHTMIVVDGFEINFTDKFKYPNLWHRFWQRIFFGFSYRLEKK